MRYNTALARFRDNPDLEASVVKLLSSADSYVGSRGA